MSHLDPLLFKRGTLPALLSQDLLLYTTTICLVLALAYLSPATLPYLYRIAKPLGLLPATAGCRKLGIPRAESNLINDEFDSRYSAGDVNGEGKSWKVKSLWIYPIKSCYGVELTESVVVKTGLAYDRWFSFARFVQPPARADKPQVPGPRWEFATMRELPLMSNVHPEMWVPDPSLPEYSDDLPAVRSQGVIRVVFPYKRGGLRGLVDLATAWFYGNEPGTMAFTVPWQPSPEQIRDRYKLEVMKIWKDFPIAINMGVDIPPELATYLGVRESTPFTLFRTHVMREVFRDAPRKEQLGWQPVAALNDAYPINMLGLASLQNLSALQPAGSAQLSARRFRSNIIIEGMPAYEEETWKYITLGEDEYHVVARCVRCKIPNVDPDTGIRHNNEPDRTIRAERKVDTGAPKGLGCLAMQMVPKNELGSIRVGDMIKVHSRGELVYTPM